MVELVDAADSKSAEGNLLRVQVSLPVPNKTWACRNAGPFLCPTRIRCIPISFWQFWDECRRKRLNSVCLWPVPKALFVKDAFCKKVASYCHWLISQHCWRGHVGSAARCVSDEDVCWTETQIPLGVWPRGICYDIGAGRSLGARPDARFIWRRGVRRV